MAGIHQLRLESVSFDDESPVYSLTRPGNPQMAEETCSNNKRSGACVGGRKIQKRMPSNRIELLTFASLNITER